MRRGPFSRPSSWCSGLLLAAVSSGLVAEGEIYVLPSGHAIDGQGNVVAEDLRLTPDDRVVGTDGRAYESGQLHLGPGGKLLTPDGSPVKKGFRLQPRTAGQATIIAPAGGTATPGGEENGRRRGPGVKMVVGGQSEEGVAKTTTLPIIK